MRQMDERAPVILTGGVLSGPVTPARIAVETYEKGSGPSEVQVDTGIYDDAAFDESIAPQPGERWRIYGEGDGTTLVTGLCYGSHEVAPGSSAPTLAIAEASATASRATFAG